MELFALDKTKYTIFHLKQYEILRHSIPHDLHLHFQGVPHALWVFWKSPQVYHVFCWHGLYIRVQEDKHPYNTIKRNKLMLSIQIACGEKGLIRIKEKYFFFFFYSNLKEILSSKKQVNI